MLQNFIRVALRSLVKQKVYSAINIIGFAISIAACLLISVYVQHELSYDDFNPKADRIYKMALERIYPDHRTFYAVVPHSFVDAIKKDFPEVENALMVNGPIGRVLVNYKSGVSEIKSFEEEHFILSDSNFFEFFDIELLKGDKNTMLSKPRQVMITESTAKRYFGHEDALGKIFNTDAGDFTVAGICKDLPENTHLKFDFVGSIESFPGLRRENFVSFTVHAYLLLKPGTNAQALEAKFPKMVDTYAAAQIERELGQSWADYTKAGNGYRYFLQPLPTIHLDPTHLEATLSPSGNKDYVLILAFIAGLILVIACINFMNLSTARSAERAREVGVRKTMGSPKAHLVYQFLTESIITALLATGIAIVLALFLLPSFNQLAETHLALHVNARTVLLLFAFAIFVGCLAGLYPAFMLSSFNPVVVMKGNFSSSGKGSWLRNGLVVFQFMISIFLIVGSLVVGEQMKFIQAKKLGFDKDQVLLVERFFSLQDKIKTFEDEARRMPQVTNAGATSALIGKEGDFFGVQFQPEGRNEILTVKMMGADDYFAETVNFELKEGKFFAEGTNDSLSIILNESAVKVLGLKDPIGARLRNNTPDNDGNEVTRLFTVIGIVKDFHFQSLRDEITPLVIQSSEFFPFKQYLAVKIKAGQTQETIKQLEEKWKALMPGQPFRYSFLDEQLKTSYAEEKRSGQLFSVFSALAIIIACVGLFGLSAYTTTLRTKEIGVRKVLGASVAGITLLLSKNFTKLVLIAFILSTPLAWWMMDKWLARFAYRVSIGTGSFLLAGAIALSIALLTVSYQSIKAALVNPVKSLRSE